MRELHGGMIKKEIPPSFLCPFFSNHPIFLYGSLDRERFWIKKLLRLFFFHFESRKLGVSCVLLTLPSFFLTEPVAKFSRSAVLLCMRVLLGGPKGGLRSTEDGAGPAHRLWGGTTEL